MSLSEPQEVKAISQLSQPSAFASCLRAFITSFAAARPFAWVELGLP